MNELGRISTSIPDAVKAGKAAHLKTGGSPTSESIQIADDDAAVVSLRTAYREKAADAYQITSNGDGSGTCRETMEEFVAAVRAGVARFLELLKQICGQRSAGESLAQSIARTTANLESGILSPAQARQEILNAAPFKDIDPEQVLFLLRNS